MRDSVKGGIGLGLAVAVALVLWWQNRPVPVPPPVVETTVEQVRPAPAVAPEETAAAPEPAPVAPPEFDVVRVTPGGQAVIAGHAAPGQRVEIVLDGVVIGGAEADAAGEFATVLEIAPSAEPRELVLRAPSGEGAAGGDVVALAPSAPEAAAGAGDAEQGASPDIAAQKAAEAQAAAEKAEAERTAAAMAEAERLAAEKAGAERLAAETEEAARIAAEQAEAARLAAERAEAERIAAETAAGEKAEAEPLAAEKAEAEKPEAKMAGTEPLATEAAGTERLAAEQAAADLAAREKAEAARVAAEKAEAARLAAEAARLAAEKAEAGRLAAEKAEAARVAAEKAEAERVAAENAEAGKAAAAAAGQVASGAEPEVRPFSLSTPVIILPQADAESAPVLVKPGPEGVTLLQPAAADSSAGIVLDRITYSDRGDMIAAGRGRPGAVIRVYANAELKATVTCDADGLWEAQIPAEAAKSAQLLRFDEIGPGGEVLSRLETPFEYSPMASVQEVRARKIVVQKGDYLWKFAEQYYGQGWRYSVIFSANADLIRDPDLIYPGQVFTVPELVNSQ
jgi:nucleoid-associated protein YgaU